jgi:transcriptional regulator with XRE-family HTH domain
MTTQQKINRPGRPKSRSNPIDIAVGENLRTLRLSKRKSQDDLGAAISVSFQQIQKYENGTNRISAGRLVQLADALGCHPIDFFKGVTDAKPGQVWGKFDTLGDVRVLETFQLIACPKQRARVVELMETLAGVDD